MSDQQQRRQGGGGCGGWLAWFLAAGAVRYVVRDVFHLGPGWQLAAVVVLLLVWLAVLGARQGGSSR